MLGLAPTIYGHCSYAYQDIVEHQNKRYIVTKLATIIEMDRYFSIQKAGDGRLYNAKKYIEIFPAFVINYTWFQI